MAGTAFPPVLNIRSVSRNGLTRTTGTYGGRAVEMTTRHNADRGAEFYVEDREVPGLMIFVGYAADMTDARIRPLLTEHIADRVAYSIGR
jgi:hypothetical protein